MTEDQAGAAPAGRTIASTPRPGQSGTVSGEEFALFAAAVRDYAILMLDCAGRVASWNAGARNIKGYEAGEIIGRSFEVFYDAEDRARGLPAQHLAEAAAAGSLSYEGWRLRKDGSRFWADVVITAVFDDDGRLRGFAKVTRDVTERREMERSLGESEERFGLFVAQVRDYAILTLDSAGRVASWNAGARNIKGYEADEIIGRSFEVFYDPEDRARGLPAQHLAEAAAAGSLSYEGWRLRKNGSRFWADVVITAVFDDDGRLRGFGKVSRDVTERRNAEERLTHRTLHDVLTGLPNRELLLDRVGQALAAMGRHPSTVALFFIDLDRFKVINDTFGHAAGDHALVTVARRLQATVRPEDTVARLSGDEFVVVCPDLKQSGEAQLVGERIASALADPVPLGTERLAVHASIGVALTDDSVTDPETLLRDADSAMYHAKRADRERCALSVFSPEMRTRLTRRLDVESALRQAVAAGELSVVYQPVIRLDGGEVESFEALLRWHRPHETVDPAEFIPVAEQSGLINPIGAWVLEQACRQAVRWDAEGSSGVAPRVAVNVSARQLHNGGLVTVLDRVLSDTNIEASRVCLEVTETQLMSDAVASIEVLTDLKRRGISLSIDDFGTGYSSLSYLRRLPVDTVKIDRSFVAGLGESTTGRQDSAIVEATIRMAQALGLAVVAEGVETHQQYAELLGLGCDYGQGWLFGRPQPPGTYDRAPAAAATSAARGPEDAA